MDIEPHFPASVQVDCKVLIDEAILSKRRQQNGRARRKCTPGSTPLKIAGGRIDKPRG